MNTESGENQAGNNKLIGSQVSLITKADSRYEGTLVEVDRVKKTMTLKNVKTMGTEGRRNGQNEIPATDNIMGQVKFKVELVKVFNIIEQPVEPEDDAKKQEDDPAIIASEEANSDEKLQEKQQKKTQVKKDDWAIGTKAQKTKGPAEK